MDALVRWLKIRAWHIFANEKDWLGDVLSSKTLCGRWVAGDSIDDRPANERTCESCLRIQVGR